MLISLLLVFNVQISNAFIFVNNSLHKFIVKQFDEGNEISPKLFFFFDNDNTFIKARIEQIDIGGYNFDAGIPF